MGDHPPQSGGPDRGAALALAGTIVVLDVFSGAYIDTIGVAWALGAAICAACYFVLSDRVAADDSGLNSVTLAAGGLVVGAAAVVALGMTSVLPLTFTTHDTVVAGHTTSFLVPVVVLGVVSTSIADTLGISGGARLRPSYASLMGWARCCARWWPRGCCSARRSHQRRPSAARWCWWASRWRPVRHPARGRRRGRHLA